jgi:hypothetical protein
LPPAGPEAAGMAKRKQSPRGKPGSGLAVELALRSHASEKSKPGMVSF